MKVMQKGVLIAWYEAKTVQKEFENILSQLEEAIFTKSCNNNEVIAYSNNKADEIMNNIEMEISKAGSLLDKEHENKRKLQILQA